jgi:nicotinate-nucleotide adenylyltransferase
LRLGFLGGTFDPIHLGHLRSAEEIAEGLGLDKVYLIPAAQPPHKSSEPVTAFCHRMAMAVRGAACSPLLEVLDIEARRPGPSYSVETLKELRGRFPEADHLYFIMGTDAFFEIRTWKNYRELFDLADLVLVERPGFALERIPPMLHELGLGISRSHDGASFSMRNGRSIIPFRATHMDISSTRLRELLKEGRSIRFLVPETICQYIAEEGLYLTNGIR